VHNVVREVHGELAVVVLKHLSASSDFGVALQRKCRHARQHLLDTQLREVLLRKRPRVEV
jgi:hypothetical protein